ncbi:MAG: hypothetical protein GY820_21885 [Gammaproteobacteria bacterium]|nr:hypothetical protein [Gammaproteobacteria bacterium]
MNNHPSSLEGTTSSSGKRARRESRHHLATKCCCHEDRSCYKESLFLRDQEEKGYEAKGYQEQDVEEVDDHKTSMLERLFQQQLRDHLLETAKVKMNKLKIA